MTFGHEINNETGELTFCSLSQKFEEETSNIYLTDYSYKKDGEEMVLSPGDSVSVISGGCKP